jgi:hypothetical protein
LALEDVTADGEANVGVSERKVVQATPGVLHGALYLDSQVVLGLEHKSLFSLDAHVARLYRTKLILRRRRAKKEKEY